MISVVIPNYNNSHYLGQAIQSALSQTYKDLEIIVVDDGSTDNSRQVVESFSNKVRYIWQENKGLGGARNTGILASQSDFIGLLDADDEWQPTFLEKMMLLVQKCPSATVFFSSAKGVDANGIDLPQYFGRMIGSGEIYQNLLRANFIIPSTVVFRRAEIEMAGLFDETNRGLHGCEDWDLWLRLLPSHRFAWTDESLIRYRLHPHTFSANPSHMQEAVKKVIEKNFGSDDGNYANWSADKKRAWGGVYRYRTLTSVQKQGNWKAAADFLCQAFTIDQTLVLDLDLYYELAFGSQPPGYRETAQDLTLEQNATLMLGMLGNIFEKQTGLRPLRDDAFGIANYAIGLVAYNTRQRRLCRRHLVRALTLSPKYFLTRNAFITLMKTYMSPVFINRFARFVRRKSDAA